MTEPRIEHHRPVEYRLADHRLQRDGFTVAPTADGRRIEVTGSCPGCGGHTTVLWEYGIPSGHKGFLGRSGARSIDRPVGARTVYCDCGHVHANRPAEAWDQGCGAYWQVELP
ncbi:hypothetical protein [Plantactinospora sp. KLBMP9567]|uniref:hypothetical protein n=1 Tax=Plantactinospora sp. KLBMP9567 TaxID=3085900 RepID=UPI00298259DC|nr:hypothetical protein [Plantactinospora sp. KLBMP9567]MDW5322523.1 hypothetical protein [Plantactinospora sp. KLBMP9567]